MVRSTLGSKSGTTLEVAEMATPLLSPISRRGDECSLDSIELMECDTPEEAAMLGQVEEGVVVPLPPKLVDVLGDPELFPPKVKQVLGQKELDPSRKTLVFRDRIAEIEHACRRRKQQLEQVAQRPPTKEQCSLPKKSERVREKALKLLGDDELAKASSNVVTAVERKTVRAHPKVVKVLGEPAILGSNKALNRLGSEMNLYQRRAMMRSNFQDEECRQDVAERRLEAILVSTPSSTQLRVPSSARANEKGLKEKALRIFGEEALYIQSRRIVTRDMQKNVSPKTLRLLGDESLLGKKERQILGNLESPTRRHKWWRVPGGMSGLVHKFTPPVTAK